MFRNKFCFSACDVFSIQFKSPELICENVCCSYFTVAFLLFFFRLHLCLSPLFVVVVCVCVCVCVRERERERERESVCLRNVLDSTHRCILLLISKDRLGQGIYYYVFFVSSSPQPFTVLGKWLYCTCTQVRIVYRCGEMVIVFILHLYTSQYKV